MFKIISISFLSTLSILFISIEAISQKNNLLGTWKGKLIDSLGEFDYQLNLNDEKNGQYIGISVSNSTGFYCETNIIGIRNGNKFIIIESGISKTNYEKKDLICLLKFDLNIVNNRLVGNYSPINNKSNCLNGKITLIQEQVKLATAINPNKAIVKPKVNKILSVQNLAKQIDLVTIKDEIKSQNNLDSSIVKKTEIKDEISTIRDKRLIKTVELDNDEAELFIYDNGIVDGDIITLIDNERVLLKKVSLSQKPIRLKINNLDQKTHNIQFFAENLGEIEPNTGLLVIKTKTRKIELFFSSDMVQSSIIRIILK